MMKRLFWLFATLFLGMHVLHAETVTYIHTDALGSPILETDAAGANVRATDYRAYGDELLNGPQRGLAFTGHYRDVDSGLVYMQQRYYDPSVGRFLSVDPVTAQSSGDIRHFSSYAYAFNNPYKFTDPDGRAAIVCAVPGPMQVCMAAGAAVAKGILWVGSAAAAAWAANEVYNEATESPDAPPDPSQTAIDKIKDGTRPADGQAGADGVLVGEGGADGAAEAMDVAKGTDGAKVLVDTPAVTVVELPDGRKVESHTSTKGGQYQGDRTVKIQDKDGKVRQENIIRYPEPKK